MYHLNDIEYKNTDIAIVDSGIKYTGDQLSTAIASAAEKLSSLGIGSGDRVALSGQNSFKFISIYFAILRIGATVVLVPADCPPARLSLIVKDVEPKLLVSDKKLTEDTVIFDHFNFGQTHYHPASTVDPEQIAVIMYTSGSVSTPKGVMLSHRALSYVAKSKSSNMLDGRKVLIAAPCYHMNGMSNMITAIAAGATLILLPKFEPVAFIDAVARYQVEMITGSPAFISILLEKNLLSEKVFTSVTELWLSSAPITEEILKGIKKYFPRALLTYSYGMTECTAKIFDHLADKPTPDFSAGFPVDAVSVKIVDGILHVKSPALFSGYTNGDSGLVDGYFVTKDLFRADDDGYYYLLGRADDAFSVGGDKAYPREIEKLIESYPGVYRSAVVGVDDVAKGKKPYAFIVSESVLEENIKKYLSEYLPYNLIPRRIIILDEMPLNSVNKIDKEKLKEKLQDLN